MKVTNEILECGGDIKDYPNKLVIKSCSSGYHKVKLTIHVDKTPETALPTFLEIEVDGDEVIKAVNNAMND